MMYDTPGILGCVFSGIQAPDTTAIASACTPTLHSYYMYEFSLPFLTMSHHPC